MSSERERLQADLERAEAEVARLRESNAQLAETFRGDSRDDLREELKRAAQSLSAARDRVEAARAALDVFDRTGSPYGVVAEGGRVHGAVAIVVKPGSSREDRTRAIDEALAARLHELAAELGCVVGAAPERYVRERPGRDAEGRTILDVAGRVEGDVLLPATSPAARRRP